MIRTTVTLDEELVDLIESRYGKRAYLNFSAIVRDLIRNSNDLCDVGGYERKRQ